MVVVAAADLAVAVFTAVGSTVVDSTAGDFIGASFTADIAAGAAEATVGRAGATTRISTARPSGIGTKCQSRLWQCSAPRGRFRLAEVQAAASTTHLAR